MKSAPTVGIITRTKDRNHFLARCIESVKRQTFPDWLHVIVNDGGDRCALEACVERHHGPGNERVHIIHHETSRGMEAASNSGLRTLGTEFVALLDDDDTWHETFLEVCVGRLQAERSDTVQGIVTLSKIVYEKVEYSGFRNTGERIMNPGLTNINLAALAHHNQFAANAFLYTRKAAEKVGFYDESLPVLGDWEFNCRFFTEFDAIVVPEPLANYHQRPSILNSIDDNTVTAGRSLHRETREAILSRRLNAELKAGRYGIGLFAYQEERIRHLDRRLRKLAKSDRRRRWLYNGILGVQVLILILIAILLYGDL